MTATTLLVSGILAACPPDPPQCRSAFGPLACADLDGSGVVDTNDLTILLGAWESHCSIADLNGDGTVGQEDLLELLADWGSECPEPEVILIDDCNSVLLNQPNKIYRLDNDVPPIQGHCFRIEADNIILDGNGKTITGTLGMEGYIAVDSGGHNNLVIKNLTIHNFPYGIVLQDTVDSVVENNMIHLGYETTSGGIGGIRVNASHGNIIRGNHVEEASFTGVHVIGDDNVISCNTFVNCAYAALGSGSVLIDDGNGNTVGYNTFVGSTGSCSNAPCMGAAIMVRPGADCTCVIGNHVENSHYDSIDVSSSYNLIQENDVMAASSDTITLRIGSNNVVIGNDIVGGPGDGYRIDAGWHDSVIIGGSVGSTARAIHVTNTNSGVDGITISGVTIDGPTVYDLQIDALSAGVQHNLAIIDTAMGAYSIAPNTLKGLRVEKSAYGSIEFVDTTFVYGTGADFDSDVKVEFNRVDVADGQVGFANCAKIKLYGLTGFPSNPDILRNGQPCSSFGVQCGPGAVCKWLSPFDPNQGIAYFRVNSSFPVYCIHQCPP